MLPPDGLLFPHTIKMQLKPANAWLLTDSKITDRAQIYEIWDIV